MKGPAVRWLLLLAAVCLVTACGCEDESEMAPRPAVSPKTVAAKPSTAPPPPPPPPPPGDPTPPTTPPGPDVPEPDTPDLAVPTNPPANPPEAEPLTVEEAIEEVEAVGGRVLENDSGEVVSVFLNRTNAANEDLEVLQYLPTIEVLNLTGTQVTDDGLEHLHALSNLKHLYPANTGITDGGLAELKQKLPECEALR